MRGHPQKKYNAVQQFCVALRLIVVHFALMLLEFCTAIPQHNRLIFCEKLKHPLCQTGGLMRKVIEQIIYTLSSFSPDGPRLFLNPSVESLVDESSSFSCVFCSVTESFFLKVASGRFC